MLVFAPSLLSAAIAAISGAVSTYGPMLARSAALVLKTMGTHLPTVIKTVEVVANLMEVSGCGAQELGAKAAKSEKKPEDFDSFHAYINHLETEVPLEPGDVEEGEASSNANTLTQLAVGASILLTGIDESQNSKISLPLLCKAALVGLAPSVIIEVIKAYDRHGINGDDFGGYIANTLSLADAAKHSQALVEALQCANPTMTLEQAEDAIMALR